MFVRLLFLLLYIISLAFTKIEIRDANVAALSRDDIDITILNTDNLGYEIKIKMLQCTEFFDAKDKDNGFMNLIGGHMGYLRAKCYKNVTLLYPNMYLHNRKGFCIIGMKFKSDNDKIIQKKANISFDTSISKRYTPTVLRGYYSRSEVKVCDSIDLDPLNKCRRVDCHMKYLGTRNFYNFKWKRCQKVPVCISDSMKEMPDVVYTPLNNKCRDMEKSVTKSDLAQIEGGMGASFVGSCEEKYHSLANINCHYGRYNNASGLCDCDEGWASTVVDKDQSDTANLFVFHMCNIEISDWYDNSSRKIKVVCLIIGILAVVVAMVMIILSFVILQIYKCMQKFDKNAVRDKDVEKSGHTKSKFMKSLKPGGKSAKKAPKSPKSPKSGKSKKKPPANQKRQSTRDSEVFSEEYDYALQFSPKSNRSSNTGDSAAEVVICKSMMDPTTTTTDRSSNTTKTIPTESDTRKSTTSKNDVSSSP